MKTFNQNSSTFNESIVNINGKIFKGKQVSIVNNKVICDDEVIDISTLTKQLHIDITVTGNVDRIENVHDVTVEGDVKGNIKADHIVKVSKNCCGNIDAGNIVEIYGNCEGNIESGNSTTVKGNCSGDIDSGNSTYVASNNKFHL